MKLTYYHILRMSVVFFGILMIIASKFLTPSIDSNKSHQQWIARENPTIPDELQSDSSSTSPPSQLLQPNNTTPLLQAATATTTTTSELKPRPQPLLEQSLDDFATRQREMMKGLIPLKFVRFVCTDSYGGCGGWADRLKGIMFSFTLAAVTNRAFILDATREVNVANFYEGNLFDWRESTLPRTSNRKTLTLACYLKWCHECIIPQLVEHWSKLDTYEEIIVTANFDCAGPWIRHYLVRNATEQFGFNNRADYMSVIYNALFRPLPVLVEAMHKIKLSPLTVSPTLQPTTSQPTVKPTTIAPPLRHLDDKDHWKFPDYAFHIRMGGAYMKNGVKVINMESEYQKEETKDTELTEFIARYQRCFNRVLQSKQIPAIVTGVDYVFVAADSQAAIEAVAAAIAPVTVVTGSAIGDIVRAYYSVDPLLSTN
jgi:hypothetical protein